jgi:hypothetical protein
MERGRKQGHKHERTQEQEQVPKGRGGKVIGDQYGLILVNDEVLEEAFMRHLPCW